MKLLLAALLVAAPLANAAVTEFDAQAMSQKMIEEMSDATTWRARALEASAIAQQCLTELKAVKPESAKAKETAAQLEHQADEIRKQIENLTKQAKEKDQEAKKLEKKEAEELRKEAEAKKQAAKDIESGKKRPEDAPPPQQ